MEYSQSLRIVKWVMFLILNVLFSKSEATVTTNPEWCDTAPLVTQVNKLTQFNFLKNGHNQSPSQIRFMFTFGSIVTDTYADAYKYTVDYTPNQAGEFIAKIASKYCNRSNNCFRTTCSKKVTVNPVTKPTIEKIPRDLPNNITIPVGNTQRITFKATDAGGDLSSIAICRADLSLPCEYLNVIKRCRSSASTRSALECSRNVTSGVTTQQSYFAIAYDKAGNVSGDSTTQTVTFVEANVAPTASLSVEINDDTTKIEASGQTLYLPNNANIRATVKGEDKNLAEANQLLGLSLVKVGGTTLSADATGKRDSHEFTSFHLTTDLTLQGQASDGALTGESSSIKLVLNEPPTISFIALNDFYTIGQVITINATATDTSGLSEFYLCKGPEGDSSCNQKLETCQNQACSFEYRVTTTGTHRFYAYAKDEQGLVTTSGKKINLYATFNGNVSVPRGDVYTNHAYNVGVTVGNTGTTAIKLKTISLSANGNKIWEKNNNCLSHNNDFILASNSTKVYSGNWTPKTATSHHLAAKITDCNNVIVNTASVQKRVITLEKPTAAKVTNITESTVTPGQYTISYSNSNAATSYILRESVANTETTRQVPPNAQNQIIVTKASEDFGKAFTYCVDSTNRAGTTTGTVCRSITVNNPNLKPGLVGFKDVGTLQKTGPYTIAWQASTGATRYILSGKAGQLSSTTPWTVLRSSLTRNYRHSNPQLGDYSYQLKTCYQNNGVEQCEVGQQLTLNHTLAYIQNARVYKTNNIAYLELNGLGFNLVNSNINIRILNTGQVFNYTLSNRVQFSTTQMRVIITDEIYSAYSNGGLYVETANGVTNAPITNIVINDTDVGTEVDLINHSPVVSDKGNVYVGNGPTLFKLNQGQIKWQRTVGDDIVVRPTLGKNNFDQDLVFVGSKDSYIYSWHEDGLERWRTKTRGPIIAEALLDDINQLYVGSMDQSLYALNSLNGNVLWQYPFTAGISQKPEIYGEGLIYVTTDDEQVHRIDRSNIGPGGLQWSDMDGSLLLDNFTSEVGNWVPERSQAELYSITRMFYITLKRAPSRHELTFFAYAAASGVQLDEIANALLQSTFGQQYYPNSDSNTAFVLKLFTAVFGDNLPNQAGGKNQAQWVNYLDSGITRSQVLVEFVQASNLINNYAQIVDLTLDLFYETCNVNQACVNDVDSDHDGLSDVAEITLELNPRDPTDGLHSPTLSASQVNAGQFTLSLVNRGNQHHYFNVLENYDTTAVQGSTLTLVRANGQHSFTAQSCIDITIGGEQTPRTYCSVLSSAVMVNITDSTVEAPMLPEQAPNNIVLFEQPTSDELTNNAAFAVTPGQFRVTEGGSVSYSVPIALPSGITGVTPSAALNYDSQGGQSNVAIGWGLSASSSITRCRQTKAIDGQFAAIKFDETDRYCLGGQRLILIGNALGGEVLEGVEGAQYRTEIDSQQHITIERDEISQALMFVARAKDGSTTYYGGNENSEVRLGVNKTITMSWLMRKTYDNLMRDDTAINYEYYNETLDGGYLGANEVIIKSIAYSGNRVEFNYTLGNVRNVSFLNDYTFSAKSLLQSIDVYNHNNVKLNHYKLTFENAINSLRQLTKVEQCSSLTGQEVCKKPITFDYQPYVDNSTFDAKQTLFTTSYHNKLVASTFIDFDGTAKPTLITLNRISDKQYNLCLQSETAICTTVDTNKKRDYIPMLAVDPDGDSKQALWVKTQFSHSDDRRAGWWKQFRVENGTWVVEELPIETVYVDIYRERMGLSKEKVIPTFADIKFADMNGDGHGDLVYTKNSDAIYVRYWDQTQQLFMGAGTEFSLANNGKLAKFIELEQAWHVVDINFDGLADVVALQCRGSVCDNPTDTDTIAIYENTGSALSYLDYVDKKAQQLNLTDINGDGLVDFIYHDNDEGYKDIKYLRFDIRKKSHVGRYSHIKSIPFNKDTDKGYSQDIAPISADLDRDGQIEYYVFDQENDEWYRYEWSPISEHLLIDTGFAISTPGFDPKRGDYAYFFDYDHDGVPDLVVKQGNTIFVKYNLQQEFRQGMLSSVTQGFGTKTDIEYSLMTNGDVYQKGDADKTAILSNDGLKVSDLLGASPLVSQVVTQSPSTLDINATTAVNYQYKGARVQFGGRGALGFESLITTTVKDGQTFITQTDYSQQYPKVGMPIRTHKTMGGLLLSDAVNEYTTTTLVTENGLNYYNTYNSKAKECAARVKTDTSLSYIIGGYNCSLNTTTQDTYNNVLTSTVEQFDVSNATDFISGIETSTAASTVTITNTYKSGEGNQRFGRLETTTAVHARPSLTNISRESAFTYYPESHIHAGMLESETIEPNGDCRTYLKTTHTYDQWGNKIQVSAENSAQKCDSHQTRNSYTDFDSEGRYAVTSRNDLFTKQTVLSRNARGQVTQVQNTDGVSAYSVYDPFGAAVANYSAIGAQTKTLMSTCSIANCVVQTIKTVNGTEIERTYVDKSARSFRSDKITVLGDWLTTTNSFDKFSRPISQTAPDMLAVTTVYDAFDRPVSVNDPNTGLITTQSISNFTHTALSSGDMDSGSQEKVTTKTVLGEVSTVTDNIGNVLTYTYDAVGNQLSIHSSADDATLITMEYDTLGRKSKTIDKDRGTWFYTYSAFGQLDTQTDANGVITTKHYDQLGRKIRTSVSGEIDNVWTFDPNNRHRLASESRGNWQRHALYDNLGRAMATVTSLESALQCADYVNVNNATKDVRISNEQLHDPVSSRCVVSLTTFDEYGRVFQQFDDYRRTTQGIFIEARGIRSHYAHGQVYKQQEAREGENGRNYHIVNTLNNKGQVTNYSKGGHSVALSFDTAGRIGAITATNIASNGNMAIQSDTYGFDSMGNLTSRRLTKMSAQQSFTYDSLNRVTHVNNIEKYGYKANGNLIEKDGWTQFYGEAANDPLHAITSRSKGNQAESFDYDANGNQTAMYKNGSSYRTITYNGRNKATSIIGNGNKIGFEYDANNRRYKRVESSKTIYYVGALELVLTTANNALPSEQYIRRYVPGAQQTYYASGRANLKWLFKDHQGSVVAITDDSGKLYKRFAYDVFGLQSEILPTELDRTLNYSVHTIFSSVANNVRGYTGHEPVKLGDDARIIHMNGRIYDAGTGRFMQADPFVQAPTNLQNYNAFSYVLNNPLSMTDPSGYFFSAFKKIGRNIIRAAVKVFGAEVVSIVGNIASIYCGPAAPACAAAWNYEFTRAMGGSPSQALKAGAIAAVTSYAFKQIGNHFTNAGGANVKAFGSVEAAKSAGLIEFGGNMLKSGQVAAQIASHAVVGGISSVANGGKFGHGFFAAGVTKGVGGAFLPGGSQLKTSQIIQGTVVSALIGGTASVISGGKFANGARTGAMQYLLNQAGEADYGQIWKDMKRTWSDYWRESNSELSGVYAVDINAVYVKGNIGGKIAYGARFNTVKGDISDFQQLGYNFNPLNFNKVFGNQVSISIGISYSPSLNSFYGETVDYSVPIPFTPFGGDYSTLYQQNGLPQATGGGLSLGLGYGASMIHTKTSSSKLFMLVGRG